MTDLTTITVTGTYKDMTGRVGYGTVEFSPEVDIFEDPTNNVVYTKQTYVFRVINGVLTAKIPATDVDNLTPDSFTYTVVERVTGMKFRRTNGVAIPSTLGETVGITQLI